MTADTRREAMQRAGTLRIPCLNAIRKAGAAGLTCHELADLLRVDVTSVRPRVTQLRDDGLVKDSGERRETPSGRRSVVWIERPRQGELW